MFYVVQHGIITLMNLGISVDVSLWNVDRISRRNLIVFFGLVSHNSTITPIIETSREEGNCMTNTSIKFHKTLLVDEVSTKITAVSVDTLVQDSMASIQ